MATLPLWLADYQLLAAALLLGVMLALAALRQPAQRLAVAKSTLAALAALALLCALPGWSLVHLFNEPSARREPREIVPLRTETANPPATRLIPTENVETIPIPAPPNRATVYEFAPSKPAAAPSNLPTYLVAAYGAGSVAVTLWLITGAILARRVRQQATPAPRELQELLQQLCGPKKTPPQLLLSDRIAAPVALGLRRPAILLPYTFDQSSRSDFVAPSPWRGGLGRGANPAEATLLEGANTIPPASPHQVEGIKQDISVTLLPILAHELAHLQHRDLHTLAATRLLLILLWPQPLYWLLRRTIRLDQETLADAAAADRAGRLDYAQQLLAWASSASTQRPPRLAGAVGLWEGPSQLKRRIAVLLNEQFNVMRSCSRRWRGGSLVAIAIIAIGLSTVTFQPQAGVADEAGEKRAEVESPETDEIESTTETAAIAAAPSDATAEQDPMVAYLGHRQTDNKTPNIIRGRCLDEANQPIADVEVELYRGKRPSGRQRLVTQTKTNAAGEFEFRNVVDPKQAFPDGVVPANFVSNTEMFTVTTRQPGRVSREILADAPYTYREGRSVDVLMPPAASLSGIVKDDAGKPIAGARVSRNGLSDFPHIFSAETNAEGRFSIDDLTPFDLEAEKKRQDEGKKAADAKLAAGADAVATFSLAPRFSIVHPEFSSQRLPLSGVPGKVEATLSPGARLRGRVLLADGSPAANTTVLVKPSVPTQGNGDWGMIDYGKYDVDRDYQVTVQTDAEGRFEADSLTPGKVDVWAEFPGWLNAGVGEFEVTTGQVKSLPQLTLTKGGVIRLQLIDDETGRPIPVDKPLVANVSVIMKNKLGRQETWPERNQISDQGVVEIASLPGTARLMLQSVDAGAEQLWLPTSNGWTAQPEATVVDGEAVDAELRVRKAPQAEEAQANAPAAEPNSSERQAKEVAERGSALVKQLVQSPNLFMGFCIDEEGQPLADIDVSLFVYEGATAGENIEPIARVRTDADGKFEFIEPVDVAKEFPNGVPEDHFVTPPVKIIAAVAKASGLATEFQNDALYQFVKRGRTAILQMKPAQKLTGRVTDGKEQPVANAVVTTTLSAGGFVPGGNLSVRTDAEGRYTIDDLPSFDAAEREREYAAARERKEPWAMMRPPGPMLSVQHPNFAAHRVSLEAIPGEVDVELLPGATIEGRVVAKSSLTNDDVRPLANVPVWITRTTVPIVDPGASYALVEQQQAMTNAEGNYSFTSLPAGGYSLTATAPDLTTVGVTGVGGEGGQTTIAPDVVLTPGAIVRTKLLDAATKQPLKLRAGRKGYVIPKLLTPGALRHDSTIATFTADGTSEIRLAPGRYSIFASIPGEGLAPNLESHSPDGKSTVGEFEVREGETLDLDVPLIAFPLQQESGVTATVAPAVTDGAAVKTQAPPLPATGHFQPLMSPADGDQPIPVPLEANPSRERDIPNEGEAKGSSPHSRADPPPASSNVRALTISGRCIDEAGNPVPNARLWLPLRPEFLDYGATLETVADDAGKFAFQIPAELRGPSAALQLTTIYAYEPGHAVGIASAYKQLKSGDLSPVEIQLPNSATTSYRILDPGGDPVADARVEPWHIPAGGIYPVALQLLLEVTSDALGIVKLRGIRESDIRSVRVHHAIWGEQEFSELNNRRLVSNNDLRLKLVGGIVGRVQTNGDGPVAGIPVYASTESESSRSDGAPRGNANTVTNAEGRFELPSIAAGRGQISFYVDRALPWRVRPGGRFIVRVDEITELNVPLERAVRAKGVVRTADTRTPVPHAQVHLRHGDLIGNWMTEQTITDEEGRFEAFVLPGEIRMYIQQKPAEFDPWECTEERRKTPIIVSDDSDTFDLPPIELERTRAFEGTIVDHNDQPVPKVQLYVTESNYIYGNTATDEEGRFVMQLPPSVKIEEYIVRTNDSRDRYVLEVVSEFPLKLRTPAPGVRQGSDAADEASEPEPATSNEGASTTSNPRAPFWAVPTSTDFKLTITGIPPTKAEADGKVIDARVQENETWRLLPEPALKVSNPTTLQGAVK